MNIFKFKKEVLQRLEQGLNDGLTKHEVYESFVGTIEKKFEKFLRMTIAYYIPKEKRMAFRKLNTILFILLIVSFMFMLLMNVNYYMHISFDFISVFFALIFVIIQIQLIVGVYKWKGVLYKSIIIIEGIKLVNLLFDLNGGYFPGWAFIYLPVLIANIIVSIVLMRKVFPSYGWGGPKKNKSAQTLDSREVYVFD